MSESYFPRWRRVDDDAAAGVVIAPDERLSWPKNVAMGAQHVVAMFGSTVLAPLLMGFDPNVAILMSGVGTLIFFLFVGGRVPSYLGSSFAFIGGVIAVTGYAGGGPNANIGVALGAIIACGLAYTLIGLIVWAANARGGAGANWIEALMPPVVTGAVVAVIGLNLAPIAAKGAMGGSGFDAAMALVTILCVGGIAVFTRGMVQRLLILVGLVLACLIYAALANGLGMGKPIDFSGVAAAAWFGLPTFTAPVFKSEAMGLIVPVAIILVAENLGHLKAVAAMTGRDMDRYLGRAFVGDGVATMVSGAVGGTGVTTYAENIGVMAVTRIYSTLVFVMAAVIALVLGFSPKFGALIQTIPGPVLGGMSVVVFGLIAVAGARIWVVNQVDFSDNRNLIVAAVTLVMGAGDFTLQLGKFTLGGIGTATFGAIILYALLGRARRR
ncbi:pyrimidine utilization transport protein G [Bordetella trematum]|uniref:Uracil permease n=1 Tax=Bordetella trematum TaxID=123899 RepID=A0A157NQP2_9BORD|nr:solute carrier family 23 protein [Bordetella trematum]AUL46447.1 pyrimidine utilization transport protein G [Bordetella trematum]AZR93218.1 pyrimidine utilization transport protein G [Bordetella trematum]NNH20865.1 pyrimidine utilization transport protein G [Bordetella trematum]QIM71820.1 pyrimidine utilization transport protein G [Bordetella trematum]SAI23346.1 uracil permease [Bordetella trematum]